MRMNSELNQLYCRAMLDREYLKKALYGLQLKQFCDIADVGCGPGGSTKIIQDCYPNASIVGIDKSKKAIEYARKKAEVCTLMKRQKGVGLGRMKLGCAAARASFCRCA